jgi:hypothetical protein
MCFKSGFFVTDVGDGWNVLIETHASYQQQCIVNSTVAVACSLHTQVNRFKQGI